MSPLPGTPVPETAARQREERIIRALMRSACPSRQDAEAELALYKAAVLDEIHLATLTLDNPYRRRGAREKWSQGVLSVSALLFRRVTRLREQASRTKAGRGVRTGV